MWGIVIADDEYITLQGLLSIDWSGAGFKVLGSASNGVEAWDLIRNGKPDLVLTDIRMPGMDGIELLANIQREVPETQVILITAYHDFDYAVSAIRLGAAGFVVKPTDPAEIVEACRKAIDKLKEARMRHSTELDLQRQLKAYRSTLRDKLEEEAGETPRNEQIAEVIKWMEAHYMEDVTIGQAGERVHLNPVYLSRLFKKETGETFTDTLTRIRMNRALSLLQDPNVRLYEVAERVGILDARYFSQLFRKHYGVTPREFRKQIHRQSGN